MRHQRPWLRRLGVLGVSGGLFLLGQSPHLGALEKIPKSVVGAARAISLNSAGKGVLAPHFAFTAYQPDRMRGVLVFQGGALFYGARGAGVEPLEGMELPPFPGIGGESGPGPMLGGDGGFWVVAASGLHRLREGGWARTSPPLPKDLQRALKWGNAWVLDPNNVLFFSTPDALVSLYDPETWAVRWKQDYPVVSDLPHPTSGGGVQGSNPKPVRVEFLSPEIVVSGHSIGIYYHNSGRIFRFEADRRKLEELDVPWVTWGRDEGKLGGRIPSEVLRSGARVEAEFPLDPFLVPVSEHTVYLVGAVSSHPGLWRSCEFNLDRGDAKSVELPLEPQDSADSPIQLPTVKGPWISLNRWLLPQAKAQRPSDDAMTEN